VDWTEGSLCLIWGWVWQTAGRKRDSLRSHFVLFTSHEIWRIDAVRCNKIQHIKLQQTFVFRTPVSFSLQLLFVKENYLPLGSTDCCVSVRMRVCEYHFNVAIFSVNPFRHVVDTDYRKLRSKIYRWPTVAYLSHRYSWKFTKLFKVWNVRDANRRTHKDTHTHTAWCSHEVTFFSFSDSVIKQGITGHAGNATNCARKCRKTAWVNRDY
jgi:hypothetical protein